MEQFILNYNNEFTSIKKCHEINRFFIERSWIVAKTKCSEVMSRCYVSWKYFGGVYSQEITLQLLEIEKKLLN